MLKNILLSVMALVIGTFITIFGVFLSVFADGGLNERLILIAIVLLVLFISSSAFAYIQPSKSLLNAAFLGGGGITVLMINHQNIYYSLYSLSILLVCLAGVFVGRKLQFLNEKKKMHSIE